MKLETLAIIAVFLVALIPNATGQGEIPYITIVEPEDGSEVGEETTLVVRAEGYNLHSPVLSVEGENMGYAGPLGNCVFEQPIYEFPNPATGDYPALPTVMTCKTKIGLESFEGEKVRVTVSVHEASGSIKDSVGLC